MSAVFTLKALAFFDPFSCMFVGCHGSANALGRGAAAVACSARSFK
jgi:hypothetical protein